MFNSIVKKSMVCVLLAGLALAVQPMNAMHGRAAQGASGYSWFKIGLGVAVGWLLVRSYVNYKCQQYKYQQAIKELNTQIMITKNECLLYGAKAGDHEMIKYWIDRGADVNYQDNEHNTALKICIDNSKRDEFCVCLRVLLENGANPNMLLINSMGRPVPILHYIVQEGAYCHPKLLEMVKLLLRYGARLQDENQVGHTVFDYLSVRIRSLQEDVAQGQMAGVGPVLIRACQMMRNCLCEHLLRDITSRNARRNKVEETLNPRIHENNTWIVNQYLGNENPGEDVG